MLETAGAREVGEKAFAIGTFAQNKVQIATAKAAAVVERCDWCSPLMVVKSESSELSKQSESRKCDKVMSQQFILPIFFCDDGRHLALCGRLAVVPDQHPCCRGRRICICRCTTSNMLSFQPLKLTTSPTFDRSSMPTKHHRRRFHPRPPTPTIKIFEDKIFFCPFAPISLRTSCLENLSI